MAYTKTFWYLKSGGWSAVTSWVASTTYPAGQWIRQTAPTTGQERCFVCIVAGTTGLSEPTWTITRGQKTTDGTITWQECTGIPGPCGDATNTSNWSGVKNTAVSVGQVIQDNAGTTYFICTTPGTTGNGSEPSWNTTAGQTTTDNTVVWTSIGAISGYSTPYQYPFARLSGVMGTGFMLAGETCYASNNHSETQSSAISITTSNGTVASPINVLCVNDSAAPPTTIATGASVSTTGSSSIAISPVFAYLYGLSFLAGNSSNAANIGMGGGGFNGALTTFDTCTFTLNNSSASSVFNPGTGSNNSSNLQTILTSCSFVFGATSQCIAWDTQAASIVGGTIAASGSVPTTLIKGGSNHSGVFLLRDVDLSAVTGTLFTPSGTNVGYVQLENCKIGSGVAMPSSGFNGALTPYFKLHNCASSAINYNYYYANNLGLVQQSTAIYNNAGATNGITNESWKFITSANTSFVSPFVSETISIWNDNSGGSKTATIELTCGSVLNNNDIWLEIEYPSSSSSPLGSTVNTRMAWFGTPTALTSSSATWTGALAHTYKMAASFTPQMKGPIKARIYVAKPSLTVYIDPLITIS